MDIEESKKIIKEMRKESLNACMNACTGAMSEIWRNEAKAIETILSELDKKEAVIDEMAKAMADEKYEEFICMEVDCEHIELQNEGKCIGGINCIKDYFTKKCEGK